MSVIELVQKNSTDKTRVQIQFKGYKEEKAYSRSFTVRGLSVDYLFSLIFFIIQKLSESPTNNIKITAYKPPEEE